jgi:DNA-directed RNA polymerase specialized sigma24 family protein
MPDSQPGCTGLSTIRLFPIHVGNAIWYFLKTGKEKCSGYPITDDGSYNDEFMAAALKKAVDSLPVAEQTMITLYYYEESSIDDIAEIMGLSVANVKVRLFRARKETA